MLLPVYCTKSKASCNSGLWTDSCFTKQVRYNFKFRKIFTPDISGWETADAQEIKKVKKYSFFHYLAFFLTLQTRCEKDH